MLHDGRDTVHFKRLIASETGDKGSQITANDRVGVKLPGNIIIVVHHFVSVRFVVEKFSNMVG